MKDRDLMPNDFGKITPLNPNFEVKIVKNRAFESHVFANLIEFTSFSELQANLTGFLGFFWD